MNPNHIPSFFRTHGSSASQQDDILFQRKEGSTTIFHGIVTDFSREERHYGTGYRIMRSFLYGEPFQFQKTAPNQFGPTSVYTNLRLEPLDGVGTARDILCYGDLTGHVSCGDELRLETRLRRGRHCFRSGWNYTVEAPLQADTWCMPLNAAAVLALLPVLLLVINIPVLLELLVELLVAILNGIMPIFIILFGFWLLLRTLLH